MASAVYRMIVKSADKFPPVKFHPFRSDSAGLQAIFFREYGFKWDQQYDCWLEWSGETIRVAANPRVVKSGCHVVGLIRVLPRVHPEYLELVQRGRVFDVHGLPATVQNRQLRTWTVCDEDTNIGNIRRITKPRTRLASLVLGRSQIRTYEEGWQGRTPSSRKNYSVC